MATRVLETPRTCELCHGEMYRIRMPSGELESLRAFRAKRYCCREHYMAARKRNALRDRRRWRWFSQEYVAL